MEDSERFVHWSIGRVFPLSSAIQEEIVPSDLHNDFTFVVEFIKKQLGSTKLILLNQRVKSAIKACKRYRNELVEVVVDNLRRSIMGSQFDSIEALSALFFITRDKCRHLASVIQLDFNGSMLVLRTCASTFQTMILDTGLTAELKMMFDTQLFSGDTSKLMVLTDLMRCLNLDKQLEETIIELTMQYVAKQVRIEFADKFDKELGPLLEWGSSVVYPVLTNFLPDDEFDIEMSHLVVRKQLVELRSSQIYEMVLQFPASTVSLNELRISIINQRQRDSLLNNFFQACDNRLLHAGTDTVKIIQFYMKTVRSFLIIDPRGVLLDKASRPIRKFLRSRDDTVTKIVDGLLDDSEDSQLSELFEELRNTKANTVDVDDITDLNWNPDPVDALPDFRKNRVGDLIESLFSIFETKSILINAFFHKFSSDLIKVTDYDVRDVVLNLECLKLRFGDDELHSIDVMVQDIMQSALIDRKIATGNGSFHTSIISHLYWPVEDFIQDSPVPLFLRPIFDQYSEKYSKVKKDRKLKVIPSLGLVDLDLEFDDGEIKSFSVTPDKASVIYAFSKMDKLSTEQLMTELFIDSDELDEILKYWVKQKVLFEVSPQFYALLKK